MFIIFAIYKKYSMKKRNLDIIGYYNEYGELFTSCSILVPYMIEFSGNSIERFLFIFTKNG